MADIADRAGEIEELNTGIAIKQRKSELKFIGVCYNCSDSIKSGVFCDADCRDDFEKRERLTK